MPTEPNASHSVTVRVEIDHHPGGLGRLTTAIGGAGGNILGVDLVVVGKDSVVRDLTVLAVDDDHVERIGQAMARVPGVVVSSIMDRTFRLHLGGKIEVRAKAPITNRDELSMAYTPGVARVCEAIVADPVKVHRYTMKANSVAIVTDGTAVLGLGDIGPYAALPVMEGKAALFKEFAGIDAFPVCLRAGSAGELVEAVQRLEPAFGGVNLEDVAAPRCFEVEEQLKSSLDIPVFHDDQHGTAVVVLAALRNALKVTGRAMGDLAVVIVGAGAAGVAIARILSEAGVGDIVAVDRHGAIHAGRDHLDGGKGWLAANTNRDQRGGSLAEVLRGAGCLIGVSGPNLVSRAELAEMAEGPIVFALANPDPEINPEEAEGVASVIATGRSDYPNQINNVLCFPGIFRGALDAGATDITEGMKMAAAEAIAGSVPEAELSPTYVVPSVFNRSVVSRVASMVAAAARAAGIVRAQPDR